MVSTIETLKNDVCDIYSYEKKKIDDANESNTSTYNKEYNFEDNTATVIFTRIWIGKAACCGPQRLGRAVVTMKTRNEELEEQIKKIIELPKNNYMRGKCPVVNDIQFTEELKV